jgi:hypothetical protein
MGRIRNQLQLYNDDENYTMMEPATIWKETHLQIEETVDPL